MNRYFLTLLTALFLADPCQAQQGEESAELGGVQSSVIIASDDGSGQMPKIQVMSLDANGPGNFIRGNISNRSAPSVFSLAQNKGVQKEIELVEAQLDQLKAINQEFDARIQEQMESIRDNKGNFDIGNAKKLAELIKNLSQEKNARMEEVFLPHQLERLRQISRQTQMKNSGDEAVFSNQEVIDALDLSAEQQEKLAEKAKELKKEMEEKVRELKVKAREELLGELTQKQREKLKSMLGNDFDVKPTTLGERARMMRKPSRGR